jgi:two-component system, cell cycle sensor histidine kinase and response regulator CckA
MIHWQPNRTRSSEYSFASKVAALYVAFSLAWVVVSDAVVALLFGGPPVAWRVELIAGLIYVAITGVLLYAVYAQREHIVSNERRMSEQRVRRLFESELIGICFWEQSGRITDANNTFLDMVGYSHEELASGTVRWDKDLIGEADKHLEGEILNDLRQRGRSEKYERCITRKDGKKIWVIAGAAILERKKGIGIAYALDVSETRRSLEERDELKDQLRQAQKLQEIGQLAGGVAHDFNNILSVMVGYTSLLEGTLDADDVRRQNTRQVLKAAGKASALIGKLLAFSRKQLLKPEKLNLNAILEETGGILGRLIGEEIELTICSEPQLWPVVADSTQFEQILINLVVNARDAMPQGGALEIRTSNVDLSEMQACFFGLVPGRYVQLSVRDTGTGMSEEVKSHIFEPFFTTKADGEGTGLGLSTVYGIVKQSGGHIEVKSSVGEGSTFNIYLPSTDYEQQVTHRFPLQEGRTQGSGPQGPATILLAEDDNDLRTLLARTLEAQGYVVLEAKDGEHAMALAAAYESPIDLLLTDLRMPRKSGADTASALRERRPTIKVIYMSGYVDNSLIRSETLMSAEGIIEKPITPDVLLQRIRYVLSGK